MKALIIDKVHEVMCQLFDTAGISYDYLPNIKPLEFEHLIGKYEILILRSKLEISPEIIDKAKNLKIIGRVGAGMENIAVNYAQSRGIQCLNSPEGNRDALGEHTLGMLLNLMHHIGSSHSDMRLGNWNREPHWGTELGEKTVAIIGYGHMGKAFAKRVSGLAHKVLAYDKYKTQFSDNYVTEASMFEIFEQADILSIHVPLTNETHYLIQNDYVNQFKKPIIILNTARGECLKTDDLVHLLQTGQVTAAGLDVLEYEQHTFETLYDQNRPASLDYLLAAQNVILTPHIAGWSHESFYKLSKIMASKVIAACC